MSLGAMAWPARAWRAAAALLVAMALALADSIGSVGWDLNDQANHYVQWWRTGKYSVNGRCFDIGVATHKALAEYAVGRDALVLGEQSETSSGKSEKFSTGCH